MLNSPKSKSTKFYANASRWEPNEIRLIQKWLEFYLLKEGEYSSYGILKHLKSLLPNRSWENIRRKFNKMQKIYKPEDLEF